MSYTEDKLRDSRDESFETPDTHKMSVGRYIATRIPTLKPPMNKAPNPFKLLALLNFQQWMFFLVGFLGWSWDAFDFFTVSLTVEQLAKQFGKSNSQITWGITLVLMFRSVGSTIFGKPSATPLDITCFNPFHRYCSRQIWPQVAFHRQQYPLHYPRTRHRLLPNLQAVPRMSCPLRHCHGWSIWQRSRNGIGRLP